jgi:hypothetical protein
MVGTMRHESSKGGRFQQVEKEVAPFMVGLGELGVVSIRQWSYRHRPGSASKTAAGATGSLGRAGLKKRCARIDNTIGQVTHQRHTDSRVRRARQPQVPYVKEEPLRTDAMYVGERSDHQGPVR